MTYCVGARVLFNVGISLNSVLFYTLSHICCCPSNLAQFLMHYNCTYSVILEFLSNP